jgi:hypothetical protein
MNKEEQNLNNSETYVWAMDRDEAKYVFHKNYNNKNPQGMLSSISYEILDIMHYNGHIEIEK